MMKPRMGITPNPVKITPLYILVLFFLIVLSACEDTDKLSISQRSIIYCSEGYPETFNPQIGISGTTIDASSHQIYDRLLSYEGTDTIIAPALATDWHVTKDGRKITFYLRKNVPFHQTSYFTPTRNFNADDVIFSFNRILDKSHPYHHVSGGNYPFFQSIKFDNLVETIERINDYTVRFHLKYADSSFLANLTSDFAVILSSEYAKTLIFQKQKQNIDTLPIGTGPFKLKEYNVGHLIRYYRHDNYWQGSAQIKQLVYDISPNATSRLTKLLAKECDVSSFPIAHEKIIQRDDLLLEATTALNVGYFGFNTRKAPFNNRLVRLAVSLAINKQALVDTVYQGKADLARSILPKTSWAYDVSLPAHKYNPAQAKTLLEQAGYAQGFNMDIWAMPVQRPYNPNAIIMAKLIQADLKKVGIKVKIVSYEWNTFLRRLSQGEHQSFLLGWSADHPDPDNFFTPMLSCSATETGNNRTFWCNRKYDAFLKKALKTTDINKRKQYYTQAMKLINAELPLLPIAHSKRFQARGTDVKGKILAGFGGISFYRVWKQQHNNHDIKATVLKPHSAIKLERNN